MSRLFWAKHDTGLLLLRVAFGLLMMVHGVPKLQNFAQIAPQFADPFGIGPAPSLVLAIFAELFCSLLVILGLFTPLALAALIVTMLVAVFYAHGADPWSQKEMAVLYLTVYTSLLVSGPGQYSLDKHLFSSSKSS